MVSMVILCFPGNRYPGLTTFLLLYYILNLTHQRVHVDQEEGGCEGVCVCVCVCVCACMHALVHVCEGVYATSPENSWACSSSSLHTFSNIALTSSAGICSGLNVL